MYCVHLPFIDSSDDDRLFRWMLSSNECCYIITFVVYAFFSAFYTAWSSTRHYLELIELKVAPQQLKKKMDGQILEQIKQLLMYSSSNTANSKSRLYSIICNAFYDDKTTTVQFKSTRVNIQQLSSFLDLLLPVYNTYPWNQIVGSSGLHMALLCGLAKKAVDEEPKAIQDGFLLTSLITRDYNEWCEVLDSYRLMFGTNDLVDELMFNYRFHMKRAGVFRTFGNLPMELKTKIIQKIPIPFNQTYVRDENSRLYRVCYRQWNRRNTKTACLLPCRQVNRQMQALVDRSPEIRSKLRTQRVVNNN